VLNEKGVNDLQNEVMMKRDGYGSAARCQVSAAGAGLFGRAQNLSQN
jgi:hypothetical protein